MYYEKKRITMRGFLIKEDQKINIISLYTEISS